MKHGAHKRHADNPLFISEMARQAYAIKYPHIKIFPQTPNIRFRQMNTKVFKRALRGMGEYTPQAKRWL